MNCPFCNHEAVRRPKMEHNTTRRNDPPSVRTIKHPRKGWYCPACKRVFRGGGGGR